MTPSETLPIHTAPFGELPTETYHRIVQAREEVFFLEQRITCPDADAIDPRSLFQWIEQEGRVIAFSGSSRRASLHEEASVGRVLVVRGKRRKGLCRRMMREALRQIAARWPGCGVHISAQAYLPKASTPRWASRRSPALRGGRYPACRHAAPEHDKTSE